MKNLIHKIKCFFDYHNDDMETKIVPGLLHRKAEAHRWKCKKCGRLTEWCVTESLFN